MAEKHFKGCSVSLVIREMQIKMTLRFYFTPIKMSKIKISTPEFLVNLWSNGYSPPLPIGVQLCRTTSLWK